ncbi:MAG: hypothetical protein ACOC5T_01000 [Elusimicrobiota bacterium]
MDWEFYVFKYKDSTLFRGGTYRAVLLRETVNSELYYNNGIHDIHVRAGTYSAKEMRTMDITYFNKTAYRYFSKASHKDISEYFSDLEEECKFLKGYYSMYSDFSIDEVFSTMSNDLFIPWYDAG